MFKAFELLTRKSVGIIYWSWPFKTQRVVNQGIISLKLMSGQDFAKAR